MFLMFDNLASTLIAGTVLLMLFAMNQRVARLSVDQAGMYAAKSQAVELGTWLQRDMSNIDEGLCPSGVQRGVTDAEYGGKGNSRTTLFGFTYCRYDEDTDTDVPIHVTYEVEEVGKKGLVERGDGEEEVPLLKLIRRVRVDENPSEESGQSAPLLTSFKIDAMDRDGNVLPATSAGKPGSSVRYVRLQFSSARPFETAGDSYLTEVNWMTSIPMQ